MISFIVINVNCKYTERKFVQICTTNMSIYMQICILISLFAQSMDAIKYI